MGGDQKGVFKNSFGNSSEIFNSSKASEMNFRDISWYLMGFCEFFRREEILWAFMVTSVGFRRFSGAFHTVSGGSRCFQCHFRGSHGFPEGL